MMFCACRFLHEFLEAVAPYYDIVVWSNTIMEYITEKLEALGLHYSSNLHVVMILDRSSVVFTDAGENCTL